jgi:hypothetical protein
MEQVVDGFPQSLGNSRALPAQQGLELGEGLLN